MQCLDTKFCAQGTGSTHHSKTNYGPLDRSVPVIQAPDDLLVLGRGRTPVLVLQVHQSPLQAELLCGYLRRCHLLELLGPLGRLAQATQVFLDLVDGGLQIQDRRRVGRQPADDRLHEFCEQNQTNEAVENFVYMEKLRFH